MPSDNAARTTDARNTFRVYEPELATTVAPSTVTAVMVGVASAAPRASTSESWTTEELEASVNAAGRATAELGLRT